MGQLKDPHAVTASKTIPALVTVSIVFYTYFLNCWALNIHVLIYII